MANLNLGREVLLLLLGTGIGFGPTLLSLNLNARRRAADVEIDRRLEVLARYASACGESARAIEGLAASERPPGVAAAAETDAMHRANGALAVEIDVVHAHFNTPSLSLGAAAFLGDWFEPTPENLATESARVKGLAPLAAQTCRADVAKLSSLLTRNLRSR